MKMPGDMNIKEYYEKYGPQISAESHWECESDTCTQFMNKSKAGSEKVICARRECPQACWEYRREGSKTLIEYNRLLDMMVATGKLNRPLVELRLGDFLDAIEDIRSEREMSGHPYKETTLQKFLTVAKSAFEFAYDHGHAANIFAHRGTVKEIYDDLFGENNKPRTREEQRDRLKELQSEERNKPRSLSNWKMKKLLKIIREGLRKDGRYLGMAIMLFAGLRPAECRGLRWGDIKSFIDHPNRLFIKLERIGVSDGRSKDQMKTQNAYRIVPAHVELLELLQKRRRQVESEYGGRIDDLPVCCFENQYEMICRDYHLAMIGELVFQRLKLTDEDYRAYKLDLEWEMLDNPSVQPGEDEHLTLYVLRRNFWTWLSAFTGLSLEEKKCVMGHAMDDRIMYNNQGRLWEILMKMDHFQINIEDRKDRTVVIKGTNTRAAFLNVGHVQITIPKDCLLACPQMTLVINAAAIERGESIDLLTVQKPRRIIRYAATISGLPAPDSVPNSINCDFENWAAFDHPTPPVRKSAMET